MYAEVQELMSKIGPIADFPAIQEFADAKVFLIAISEELIVEAHAVEARGLLQLVADLGKPVRGDHAKIGEIALNYAGLWEDNDGSYLGTDPMSGNARLYCPLAVSALDPEKLAANILAFANRALGWKTALADAKATSQDSDIHMGSDRVIRG